MLLVEVSTIKDHVTNRTGEHRSSAATRHSNQTAINTQSAGATTPSHTYRPNQAQALRSACSLAP
eukprot:4706619-Pleurochrysis_carterae.AAC.2